MKEITLEWGGGGGGKKEIKKKLTNKGMKLFKINKKHK